MEFKFKIMPPNFAITDKGKFSIADLDLKEFEKYCKAFQEAIGQNRERILKLRVSQQNNNI